MSFSTVVNPREQCEYEFKHALQKIIDGTSEDGRSNFSFEKAFQFSPIRFTELTTELILNPNQHGLTNHTYNQFTKKVKQLCDASLVSEDIVQDKQQTSQLKILNALLLQYQNQSEQNRPASQSIRFDN